MWKDFKRVSFTLKCFIVYVIWFVGNDGLSLPSILGREAALVTKLTSYPMFSFCTVIQIYLMLRWTKKALVPVHPN